MLPSAQDFAKTIADYIDKTYGYLPVIIKEAGRMDRHVHKVVVNSKEPHVWYRSFIVVEGLWFWSNLGACNFKVGTPQEIIQNITTEVHNSEVIFDKNATSIEMTKFTRSSYCKKKNLERMVVPLSITRVIFIGYVANTDEVTFKENQLGTDMLFEVSTNGSSRSLFIVVREVDNVYMYHNVVKIKTKNGPPLFSVRKDELVSLGNDCLNYALDVFDSWVNKLCKRL